MTTSGEYGRPVRAFWCRLVGHRYASLSVRYSKFPRCERCARRSRLGILGTQPRSVRDVRAAREDEVLTHPELFGLPPHGSTER